MLFRFSAARDARTRCRAPIGFRLFAFSAAQKKRGAKQRTAQTKQSPAQSRSGRDFLDRFMHDSCKIRQA
jgi:hypothetical protein